MADDSDKPTVAGQSTPVDLENPLFFALENRMFAGVFTLPSGKEVQGKFDVAGRRGGFAGRHVLRRVGGRSRRLGRVDDRRFLSRKGNSASCPEFRRIVPERNRGQSLDTGLARVRFSLTRRSRCRAVQGGRPLLVRRFLLRVRVHLPGVRSFRLRPRRRFRSEPQSVDLGDPEDSGNSQKQGQAAEIHELRCHGGSSSRVRKRTLRGDHSFYFSRVVLISAGVGNRYGHPHPKALGLCAVDWRKGFRRQFERMPVSSHSKNGKRD